MEYLHYAKSAYNSKNIQNKLDIGTDGIEIQLVNVQKDNFWKDNWLDLVPLEQKKQIKLIHMPLTQTRYRDEIIQNSYGIESKMGSDCLERLIGHVQKLSFVTGNSIGIVCHIELPDTILKRSVIWPGAKEFAETAWDVHILKMKTLAYTYPDITFYIENSTLIESPLTSYRFVRDINAPNVRMCVDTCHLMMCKVAAKRIKDDGHPYYSVKEYFNISKEFIGLLHFCGAKDVGRGYGYGAGHGCVTSEKDAKKFYKALKTHNLNVPLTLEVKEKDYQNCINYKEQLELCKRMEQTMS